MATSTPTLAAAFTPIPPMAGAALAGPSDEGVPTFTLSDAARRDWTAAALPLAFPAGGNPLAFETFASTAKWFARMFLSPEALAGIARLANGTRPAVLLKNLPIDPELPDPPTDGRRPAAKRTAVSEAILVGVGELLGRVVSYHQEKGGDLVHQVTPLPGQADSQSNGGRVPFGWHVDNSVLERAAMPEVLGLLGLRNDPRAATKVLDPAVVAAATDAADLELLGLPEYQVHAPESFNFGHDVWSGPCPVLSEVAPGRFEVAMSAKVRGVTPRAAGALKRFRDLLDATEGVPVVLGGDRRGGSDLLLFSNRYALHARGEIAEGHRWLQRVYVAFDVEPLHAMTGTRPPVRTFDARRLVRGQNRPCGGRCVACRQQQIES